MEREVSFVGLGEAVFIADIESFIEKNPVPTRTRYTATMKDIVNNTIDGKRMLAEILHVFAPKYEGDEFVYGFEGGVVELIWSDSDDDPTELSGSVLTRRTERENSTLFKIINEFAGKDDDLRIILRHKLRIMRANKNTFTSKSNMTTSSSIVLDDLLDDIANHTFDFTVDNYYVDDKIRSISSKLKQIAHDYLRKFHHTEKYGTDFIDIMRLLQDDTTQHYDITSIQGAPEWFKNIIEEDD